MEQKLSADSTEERGGGSPSPKSTKFLSTLHLFDQNFRVETRGVPWTLYVDYEFCKIKWKDSQIFFAQKLGCVLSMSVYVRFMGHHPLSRSQENRKPS